MMHGTVPEQIYRRNYLTIGIRALFAVALLLLFWDGDVAAIDPGFKVLAFYSTDVEPDHVHTANDALAFYRVLAAKNNFVFDATTDWAKLNERDLKPYRLILWLNNFPQTPEQRAAFEKYMEHGGGWIGFHVAGYKRQSYMWSPGTADVRLISTSARQHSNQLKQRLASHPPQQQA